MYIKKNDALFDLIDLNLKQVVALRRALDITKCAGQMDDRQRKLDEHLAKFYDGDLYSSLAKCKHLKAFIKPQSPYGYFYCPDCETDIPMYKAINNLLDEVRERLNI